jgi:steroid delta-isomerase-like uncharacterized protein
MGHDASGSGQAAHATGRDMTRDEIVALFDRRQEAWDNLDAAALCASYATHCVVQSPMGGTHEGRASAQAVLQAWFDAFVDLKVRVERLLVDGQRVAQVFAVEGTHIGPFMGMPPTHKHFKFTSVFIYELENGQIIHERRIYDFTGLLVQIGVLKAKPV